MALFDLPSISRSQDLVLAGGKALQAAEQLGAQRQVLAMGGVPAEPLLNRLPELLIATGFLQEIHRPGLHRPHHHRHVAVGRHDDGRHVDLAVIELFEQFQAANARHADVQQQTARPRRAAGVEELLRRLVRLRPQVHGTDQHRQGLPHGRIVVDDKDGRFSLHG